MTYLWQGALLLVLLALGVHFTIYASKHSLVRVIDPHKDFVVRYPRVFLWLSIVFFAVVGCLVLLFLVWQSFDAVRIVLLSVLCVCGIPVLLLALVWRIKVFDEFIITYSMLGVKKQVYYKDIKHVTVTKSAFLMETTIKNYKFSANIVYREEFLLRLRENGVEIDRFL